MYAIKNVLFVNDIVIVQPPPATLRVSEGISERPYLCYNVNVEHLPETVMFKEMTIVLLSVVVGILLAIGGPLWVAIHNQKEWVGHAISVAGLLVLASGLVYVLVWPFIKSSRVDTKIFGRDTE